MVIFRYDRLSHHPSFSTLLHEFLQKIPVTFTQYGSSCPLLGLMTVFNTDQPLEDLASIPKASGKSTARTHLTPGLPVVRHPSTKMT
jgi:hypothetical protein